MRPALIIVDMLKATFEGHPDTKIVAYAKEFLPRLNSMIDDFHARGFPVVFACDSFLHNDFIFRGRMPPHSLRGTRQEQVIDALHKSDQDFIVPKRRFSGFYKTDLDQTLRTESVDTALIAGIATHICILHTALDAVAHDFRAIILEDCCAAHRPEYHMPVLDIYRKTPLYPLLQVMTAQAARSYVQNGGRDI